MMKTWKKKWIKALRSGNYKQTRGTLKNDEGFCCLGVLCDIHPKVTWGERDAANFEFEVSESELPREFRLHLGIPKNKHNRLMHLNDGLRQDFSEIADWIEKHL
jgi:hypothetical protein